MTSPHLYAQQGLARGMDPAVIGAAQERLQAAAERGVDAVLTLGHLARLTGASHDYLRSVVSRKSDPYIDISRPKKTGGVRYISSPEPILADVQRWILRHAISTQRLHDSAYAYVPGRSAVDCARRHVGARWMVKIDLHDFFDNIDEYSIYRVFRESGHSALVSLELARITTRARPDLGRGSRTAFEKYPVIRSYVVSAVGCLPQGSPTSGMLANLASLRLDSALSQISRDRGLVYTRYSDDIVFSSAMPFVRSDAESLVRSARKVVFACGHALHEKKTRIVPPGARKVVLGLVVGVSDVHLPAAFKRRVEIHLRGAEKFGVEAHAANRGFLSIFGFLRHVEGCLVYARGVDREWAERMAMRWRAIVSEYGLESEI